MTIDLDPFQQVIYRPFTTTPTNISFGITSNIANIVVESPYGLPIAGQPISYSFDVAWNPVGSSVAWGYDNYNGKCVSVYDFSAGTLTKVADIVNASSCRSLVWINNTTLFVQALSGTDGGITRWTRSGNTFTKAAQNSTYSGGNISSARLTSYGVWAGSELFNLTTLAKITNLPFSGYKAACFGNLIVTYGNSSETVNPVRVYNYAPATNTFTTETAFIPPKYTNATPGSVAKFPAAIDMKWASNKLIYGVNYGGYNPIALVYQRNGTNSWTLLKQVPTTQPTVGQGASLTQLATKGSEFSLTGFGFGFGETDRNFSRYDLLGNLIQNVSYDYVAHHAIVYHPSQNYVALAALTSNGTSFRVLPY